MGKKIFRIYFFIVFVVFTIVSIMLFDNIILGQYAEKVYQEQTSPPSAEETAAGEPEAEPVPELGDLVELPKSIYLEDAALRPDEYKIYSYDKDGNQTGCYHYFVHSSQPDSGELSSYEIWKYDERGNCVYYETDSIVSSEKEEKSISYEYDEDGRILSRTAYIYNNRWEKENQTMRVDEVGITKYEYDEEGRILSEVTYADDVLQDMQVYRYLEDRTACISRHYRNDGSLDGTYKELWNENGDRLLHYYYDEKGNLKYYACYQYDEQGRLIYQTGTEEWTGSLSPVYEMRAEWQEDGTCQESWYQLTKPWYLSGQLEEIRTITYNENGEEIKGTVRESQNDEERLYYLAVQNDGRISEKLSIPEEGAFNYYRWYCYDDGERVSLMAEVRTKRDGLTGSIHCYEYNEMGLLTQEMIYGVRDDITIQDSDGRSLKIECTSIEGKSYKRIFRVNTFDTVRSGDTVQLETDQAADAVTEHGVELIFNEDDSLKQVIYSGMQ